MGMVCVDNITGRVREWCRIGTPASYDPAIHLLLALSEPPADGTYWNIALSQWAPLPPKTDQERDSELQAFLDTAGGKVAKALVTVLMQKGLFTLAELRAAYRAL